MRENAILTSVSCFHRPWVALETRGVRKQCFFQQQHKNTIFFSFFFRNSPFAMFGVGWDLAVPTSPVNRTKKTKKDKKVYSIRIDLMVCER